MLLYVTLVLNKTLRSDIIEEMFDTVTAILRDRYGVSLHVHKLYDDLLEHPRLIINDYDPVVLTEIPPLETLLRVLLAIDRITELSIVKGVENTVSESNV